MTGRPAHAGWWDTRERHSSTSATRAVVDRILAACPRGGGWWDRGGGATLQWLDHDMMELSIHPDGTIVEGLDFTIVTEAEAIALTLAATRK